MPDTNVFSPEQIPTFDELLGDIEDDKVATLSKYFEKYEFVNGEFIFHEGEDSDALYVIQAGKVEVSKIVDEDKQEYMPFVTLDEGNILGEVSFVRGSKRSANAIVTQYSEVYKLTRDDFEEIVKKYPSLACNVYDAILQVLAYRLHRTDKQIVNSNQ